MDRYDGPICYVGHDHEATDGRMIEGGWHYTVIAATLPDGSPFPKQDDQSDPTMPGEKLTLHADGHYYLAGEKTESHLAKHHKQFVLVPVLGSVGNPQTDEEFEAARRHLDELEERLADGELQPKDHLATKPEHIVTLRDWLTEAEARR